MWRPPADASAAYPPTNTHHLPYPPYQSTPESPAFSAAHAPTSRPLPRTPPFTKKIPPWAPRPPSRPGQCQPPNVWAAGRVESHPLITQHQNAPAWWANQDQSSFQIHLSRRAVSQQPPRAPRVSFSAGRPGPPREAEKLRRPPTRKNRKAKEVHATPPRWGHRHRSLGPRGEEQGFPASKAGSRGRKRLRPGRLRVKVTASDPTDPAKAPTRSPSQHSQLQRIPQGLEATLWFSRGGTLFFRSTERGHPRSLRATAAGRRATADGRFRDAHSLLSQAPETVAA